MTLAPNLACPIDVATDGQCVYWVNAGNCTGAFQDYAPQPATGSVMSLEVPR
jgi:hypothetical protein